MLSLFCSYGFDDSDTIDFTALGKLMVELMIVLPSDTTFGQ